VQFPCPAGGPTFPSLFYLQCPNCHADYNAPTTTRCSESRTIGATITIVTASVRLEESAPLVSRAYQSGWTHTCRVETNRVNLEAPRRAIEVFQNPTKQRSRSLTARLTKARRRDSGQQSRGIEFRDQDGITNWTLHDLKCPHRFPLTNCSGRIRCPHNDMLFREPNINAAENLPQKLL